ncbi:hypothetical protein C2G38_2043533 [Gigaspora rosea]|uniref:CCHC-type domain-containing protein n=1 Tax=Gigaspora rosea TaxID=44941 RepID=A0A397UJC4_9GLOM|nr:hypothetical protein C2G38_2043533 [Gigaspora rosea]
MTFTLGIQSTSFVEGQNACIKRVLENSNTSLCDLGKVLMERSEEEKKRKQFEEWKRGIPSTTTTLTIFPTIESLIKSYLRPNVSRFLIEQMKESLYYNANQSSIKKVESLADDKPAVTEDIEDEPDKVALCAKYLLENLEQSEIKENYLEQVRAKEEELIKTQEASTQTSSDDNINLGFGIWDDGQIPNYSKSGFCQHVYMNPRKVTGKRRPKGTSLYSKSTLQETSSKKKREYTCEFCKEPGHNITTCPDRR